MDDAARGPKEEGDRRAMCFFLDLGLELVAFLAPSLLISSI
jgi:hypothetical protein